MLVPIRRALISVSDKADLVPFARALAAMNVEIISTGGTARALAEAGIDVIPVEQVTGFPEMMDGRVKTLHPSIHGAVLARRDLPAHVQAMADHDITPIDLVCVNLYPFERTILKDDATNEEAIEQIDIGGPAMLRSAAKNHAHVTVITSADQYDAVIRDMHAHDGATTIELRRDLASAAFGRTAEYDATISAWMCSRRDRMFPEILRLSYSLKGKLRYGENPHQHAAVYINPSSAEPSVVSAGMLHGKELSYNNLNDGAAALALVQELAEVFPDHVSAVIVKHANPCGAAIAESLPDAFNHAYECDPLAAFGGIVALGGNVDIAVADAVCEGKRFLEVIIAPSFEDDAAAQLGARWKDVRLLSVHRLAHTAQRKLNYTSLPGGMLVQERDMRLASPRDWKHEAGPQPDESILTDALFTWTIAKYLKSNAIAIGRNGKLLGAGVGQVDRVTACRLAVEKAGDRLTAGAPIVAASEAFFPFPDGPELLIDAGVTCLIHPGGSKRDQDTFDLCNQRNVTCLTTGTRHFRH